MREKYSTLLFGKFASADGIIAEHQKIIGNQRCVFYGKMGSMVSKKILRADFNGSQSQNPSYS